jgi:hypothetical protein
MKTIFKTFIFLLLPLISFAKEGEAGKYTKQKQVNKAYIVNPDAGIDIQNTYGNIFVTTWDEDKIELNVLIKVSGNDEDWVDKRLASIDIDINALKNLVSAKTVIGNFSQKSGKNSSIEISYTLKIPKKGGVKLNNKYGNIMTADLFGDTHISCKYGRLTMAKLNSDTNTIDMEYISQAVIDQMTAGSISANYSRITVNNFGKLNFSSNYSDLTASGGNLNYSSNYGAISLGKVDNLNGNGNYLTINTTEVGGNLNLETQYSSVKIKNIAASGGNVRINSGYTTVFMGYNQNYSFDFDINLKYASLSCDDLQMNIRNESNKNKTYKGFYKKSGVNKVAINADYGNISLVKN